MRAWVGVPDTVPTPVMCAFACPSPHGRAVLARRLSDVGTGGGLAPIAARPGPAGDFAKVPRQAPSWRTMFPVIGLVMSLMFTLVGLMLRSFVWSARLAMRSFQVLVVLVVAAVAAFSARRRR